MWFETKSVWLTKGNANGGTLLNAFDNAMRDAKIADFNIIKVTSIIPPNTRVSVLRDNDSLIKGRGYMLPAVYQSIESDEVGEEISVGVGIGIPSANELNSGVVFTYGTKGPVSEVEQTLKNMINEGMNEMRMIPEFKFLCATSTAIVTTGPTCVFASAAFCDANLQVLFEDAIKK